MLLFWAPSKGNKNIMADSSQQIVMLDPSSNIIENGQIVTVTNGTEMEQDVNEDILKQALEEASKEFVDNGVEYVADVADGTDLSEGTVTADGTQYRLIATTDTHTIEDTGQELAGDQILQLSDDKVLDEQEIEEDLQDSVVADDTVTTQQQAQQSTTVTVVTTGANGEPLGSSTNPIRIIQQGNQYTPMQQLTADQLAQIMQVRNQINVYTYGIITRTINKYTLYSTGCSAAAACKKLSRGLHSLI